MRVLVLSQHFWPESFRINEVTRALKEAGVDVRVLTGKPNYPEGRILPGYRAVGTQTEAWHGIPIHRVPLSPRGRGGHVRLAANYLSFVASASALGPGLLGGWKPDVVFVYGTSPILQAVAGVRIARWAEARVVTWVQDHWPEALEVTGYVRNRAALGLVGRAVRWVYHQSDLLLTQSEGFAEAVHGRTNGTRVEVHPNPADPIRLSPTPPPLELPDGFNIVYAGNFGLAQRLDLAIAAAARLTDVPSARFVLVGSGREDERLRTLARGLPNVIFAGRHPEAAMPAILTRADVLFASLDPHPGIAPVVPSKVQTYLAAGRPILAAMDGEGARVVREADAGLVTPAGDPEALADGVRQLAALSPERRAEMGRNGRDYHARHFHPDVLTSRLIGHFESVLASAPR